MTTFDLSVHRNVHEKRPRRRSMVWATAGLLLFGACRSSTAPTSSTSPATASVGAGAAPSIAVQSADADVAATPDAGPNPSVVQPATVAWADAPVVLTASRNYLTAEDAAPALTTPAPVSFTVPPDIYARTGNAGNGQVELHFRTPDGVATCTYQGASTVSHPTTDLDRMRGRRYRLVSCDNGDQAGQSETSNWFSLQVLGGDALDPSGVTSVSLNLGGGCSDQLPAPLAADEVSAMRDGFTWDSIAKLPETDTDGHPALYHGLIYIESKDQLAALDRLKIYWSAQPLSERYMADLRGKCGRVEHATDGRGVVVYAVFPAQIFNMLRDAGIQSIRANVAPPFRFIIPSPPDQPDYVNADGSLKYAALASSGYGDWLASRPATQALWGLSALEKVGDVAEDAASWTEENVVEPAVQIAELPITVATGGLPKLVDSLVNDGDDFWMGVQKILGDIGSGLLGSVTMHLTFSIENRDPQFPLGSPLVRLWGPPDATGQRPRVVPTGVHVRVRQWGFGFLPLMHEAQLADDGQVTLKATKGQSGRDGDLCIELATDYGSVTTDLIPNEVCDFAQGRYGDYTHDIDDTLAISQADVFSFTQLKDSADYYRTIMGASPYKLDVLTGWIANEATQIIAKKHRAMTLCLGFPGMASSAITAAASALGAASDLLLGPIGDVVGTVSSAILEKDLWWPDAGDASPARDSRGVMTHEYGHFAMCSLLFDQGGPGGLTGLIARVFEGQDDARTDEVAQMTEAWADTFAMQVVGGTNYIRGAHATAGVVSFCTSSPCMDENYVGANDYDAANPFLDELARFESLIYDAFDRQDALGRFTSAIANGDVLHYDKRLQLEISPTPYLTNADENVSLPASAWRTWVKHWLALGLKPSHANVMGGLVQTMADQGYNWCDRCDLFALHAKETPPSAFDADPTGRPAPTIGQQMLRWQACTSSPELKSWLGAAPAPYLNMTPSCTACPLHSFVDANGVCQPCGPNQVAHGNSCQDCAGTFASESSEECVVG